MLKYLYGMDSFERHRSLAEVIRTTAPAPATILDVGGEKSIRCNHLGRFLRGYEIQTVNVARSADTQYEGARLPFPDRSFDIVTSLDTAEHVRRAERAAWIADFFRVARRAVILCGPLGTDVQSRIDRELNELHRTLFGHDHHYLSEHVACTMPDLEEIRSWVQGRSYRLLFDGDARVYERQQSVLFRWQKAAGPLKSPAKYIHQLYTLKDLRPLHLQAEPGPHTRRWYLAVTLG